MSESAARKSSEDGTSSIRLKANAATTTSRDHYAQPASAEESESKSQPSSPKRRRFDPPPLDKKSQRHHVIAHADDVEVLHQKTSLSFFLHRSRTVSSDGRQDCTWFAQGVTTLYLQINKNKDTASISAATKDNNSNADNSSSAESKTNTKGADGLVELSLHLRGTCHVKSVGVETVRRCESDGSQSPPSSTHRLTKLRTTFQHFDPLQRVLLKPASSYTMDDVVQLAAADKPSAKPSDRRHQADSQSCRHAIGMTSAIRAASIASNMGELHVTTVDDSNVLGSGMSTITTSSSSAADDIVISHVEDVWKNDLAAHVSSGDVQSRLSAQLSMRSAGRRANRIDYVASRLADDSNKISMKVTVSYRIELGYPQKDVVGIDSFVRHLGGIHAVTTKDTPHIYTTAGVLGDHEGPRSWIPILDSASTKHRTSHEITIRVTAPMKDGISVIGFGEDFGSSETILHDQLTVDSDHSVGAGAEHNLLEGLERELGADTVAWLRECSGHGGIDDKYSPHVIPPESSGLFPRITPIDLILATNVWSSNSWLPISPRSLGFAIGPFRVLDDPEYINSVLDEDDDQSDNEGDGDGDVDKGQTKIDQDASGSDTEIDVDDASSMDAFEKARANGEGIRQAYFAPIFSRKHIHANGSTMSLLPDTSISLSPLSQSQIDLCNELDKSVLTSTVGVPHRALSMMRDVLALPAFRTVSYTQLWIPNAVQGGATSGSLHNCPEVLCNPFLGGSIIDSRLLPPPNHRLPYHHGGRPLQFVQARCAIRGWITSAIPLAGRDDVGQGYIHYLIESFMMSLYERGHGAQGEGGAEGGVYFSKRFSPKSGLNSPNLDFLPVQNIEDSDFDEIGGLINSVPLEDRNNEQLWRSASNGTESHTSATDEFAIRQLLTLDAVNALERNSEGGKTVPQPSMGWMGSFLSLSFLSSNANSSSDLGCGALELQHPTGGLPYRVLKGDLFRRIVEGRSGITNFVRLIRAAFVAAHLSDLGKRELRYPPDKKSLSAEPWKPKTGQKDADKDALERPKPRFIVCVNEILRKRGLSHTLFIRALQNLSGRARDALLLGTLVDVERTQKDPRTGKSFVDPEGFPNSYVRGASELYLRVGVFVEPASNTSGNNIVKGVQLQSYAEPVIPEGGTSFGGPITLRVVENQGALQEVTRDLNPDGSRRDWGSLTLHAGPVTDLKTQTAASGSIEHDEGGIPKGDVETAKGVTSSRSRHHPLGLSGVTARAFTESNIHKSGYQALELVRITNLTPLLWTRVDPQALYGGRIYVFQPDACLAEMLFHDGDAGAQVEASRALAERPLKIQGSVKITNVHDVDVKELPVRVLADCLRGSPALHSDLPHTPAVRAHAALAIAQWQNNKAPMNRTDMGGSSWLGLDLLIQYFLERFYNNGTVMPVKFNRVTVKMNGTESTQGAQTEGGNQAMKAIEDDGCRYLDQFEEGSDRAEALEEADQIDVEEDEEYRVRSAVITAIASIRAKDGMTPPGALIFLETILQAADAEMAGGHVVSQDEEILMEKKVKGNKDAVEDSLGDVVLLPYASSMLIADTLLALSMVNVSPSLIVDPVSGKIVQSNVRHPASRLIELSRRQLDWELYRQRIRHQVEAEVLSGISGVCHDSVAACAVTSLSLLSILRQSTTDPTVELAPESDIDETNRRKNLEEAATAEFYIKIFDSEPRYSDVLRASCAQAIACICCASDRFETPPRKPVGLLTALEFLLSRIVDHETTPGLRHSLANLMLDSCTGKVGSVQRVGVVGGINDLVSSAARLLNGPLGAAAGNDVGASMINTVSAELFPAANAVNDGARRGLKFLKHAGHPREPIDEETLVRIAIFASDLWRTINGEPIVIIKSAPGFLNGSIGVCANDGQLRCALMALWQWLWPKNCMAVVAVQRRQPSEWTNNIDKLGVDRVMKTSAEEEDSSLQEERILLEMKNRVTMEIDRQIWRGEMSSEAYKIYRSTPKPSTTVSEMSAKERGIGEPLPPIERDKAFKAGGWVSAAAQQRRSKNLDGGGILTKVRLRKSVAD